MPHCARGVGLNCMGLSILDKLPWLQLLSCNTLGRVTVAIKTAKLQLCILKQSCIDVHWSTMSTWTIWACAKQYHDVQPGPRLLSFDVLVLEISFGLLPILWNRWTFQSERQFFCGQLTLHWTLDHWQWPSRCTNHAITHEQSLSLKI